MSNEGFAFRDSCGQPTHPNSSRRAALQAGAVGLLGLGMGQLDELRALGAQSGRAKAKSVIFVFLSGGLSHIDSYGRFPCGS